jgi:hypothetical protein
MACYHPLEAFRNRSIDPIGPKIIFNPWVAFRSSEAYDAIKLPCGQCIGCRLERSRQWAMRCCHEASLHLQNCFITLTFSPEYLDTRPNKWSLDVRDYQLFMKRFRRRFGSGIRFYHCGEYGEMCSNCDKSLFYCTCPVPSKILGRPHYHACIFGFDFPDKELFRVTNTGHKLYISKFLDDLWTDPHTDMPMGFCTIGDVTFESAAYVARYIMKKINGDMQDNHYVHHSTGEILKPEYTTMSRRPGIARDFYDKYQHDIYPHDFVVFNGKKMRPPRYYDGILKTERPYTFDDIKFKREENANKHIDNNTPERLNVREQVQVESLKLLTRNKDF